MQFQIAPESELIIRCPKCFNKLSIHNLDDRITCSQCYSAFNHRDNGNMSYAFASFDGDMIGKKYLRYPPNKLRESELCQ